VTSKVGKGSTFGVILPVAVTPQGNAPRPKSR
jgi:hypothetical protein